MPRYESSISSGNASARCRARWRDRLLIRRQTLRLRPLAIRTRLLPQLVVNAGQPHMRQRSFGLDRSRLLQCLHRALRIPRQRQRVTKHHIALVVVRVISQRGFAFLDGLRQAISPGIGHFQKVMGLDHGRLLGYELLEFRNGPIVVSERHQTSGQLVAGNIRIGYKFQGLAQNRHGPRNAKIPTRCFMQVEGSALRMPYKDIQREFLDKEELRDCVLQGVQSHGFILGQLAACNRLHEAEERLARWLLMVRDRVESDTFTLTQKFLATMLGSRRTTVTAAAGALQRRGLIRYSRGRIQIVDSATLETVACECYPLVRNLYLNFHRQLPAG